MSVIEHMPVIEQFLLYIEQIPLIENFSVQETRETREKNPNPNCRAGIGSGFT